MAEITCSRNVPEERQTGQLEQHNNVDVFLSLLDGFLFQTTDGNWKIMIIKEAASLIYKVSPSSHRVFLSKSFNMV